MDGSWDDWRFVHAAWEHGSFTAAAEALGVGQATVSRRVAQVEEGLGHALFERHRTGLVPTAAARALRPHLDAIAAAADGATRALAGLEAEPAGVVRITGTPGFCVDVLPRLARRLLESHPAIRLEALSDMDVRDLERREADLALRLAPTSHGDLLVRRLAALQPDFYASPELLARLPGRVPLSQVPFVQFTEAMAHLPTARMVERVTEVPASFQSNDYLALRAAAAAGLGAILCSAQEARWLGLVPVPHDLPPLQARPVYLVVHRALRHVPRIAVVVDAIGQLMAELAGDAVLHDPDVGTVHRAVDVRGPGV